MEENKIIRCIACGITEEEAKKEGLILKRIEPFESVETGNSTINYAFLNADGMYVCSKCKDKFLSVISSKDKIMEINAKISAFEDFITSSAFLMNLETQVVTEAALKVYTTGIADVARYSPEIALIIMSDTARLFQSLIQEIKKKKMEKEEREHFTFRG